MSGSMSMMMNLLILYGTQTGTSQEVAERIGRDSRRHHFKTKVLSMDQYDPIHLPLEKLVVFVASTTGQGDVPDNMKAFWKFMLRKNLQSDSLNSVKAAVIGLGDSSYPKFNFVGKKLFARLKSLGCNLIVRRGDCDDQHEFGIDYEVEKWSQELWNAVLEYYPMPPGLSVKNKDILSPPRFQINTSHSHTTSSHQETEFPPNTPPYTQNNPFYSKLVCNTRITSPFAENDVRHIELDISSPSGAVPSIIYNPGDVVYLWPHNPRDLALSFLHFLDLDPHFLITSLHPNEEDTPIPLHTTLPLPMTLLDIFVQYLDIQGSPRRYFFELLSFFATEEREKERLQHFASSEGQDDLQLYHYRERRTYFEIFRDFPSAKPPVEYIFDLIPPIHPRPFSISSSQKLHPNTIQISVSILKYTTPTKRQKIGVCSNWLSDLDPSFLGDSKIPIFVKSSGAHLPNPIQSSVVMIGPGTGCAIFRAFMQEKHALLQHERKNSQTIQTEEEENENEKDKVAHLDLNSTKCMFFFGCRKESCDFLYRSEFESYLQDQTITDLVVAFSRDQPKKIYVQNKLEECGKSVWDLIQNGGYFCVSGSAKKMPQDVKNSLLNVIEKHGDMNREAAEEYVRDMELKNRYICETWY